MKNIKPTTDDVRRSTNYENFYKADSLQIIAAVFPDEWRPDTAPQTGQSTDQTALSADRLASPADAYGNSPGGTDFRAGTAVEAIGRSVRQALPICHHKTIDRAGIYAIPTPRALVPVY